MRCFIADTIATIIFFKLIAALTELFVAGANQKEVIILLASTSFLMFIVRRPFGLHLEAVRTWANVTNP